MTGYASFIKFNKRKINAFYYRRREDMLRLLSLIKMLFNIADEFSRGYVCNTGTGTQEIGEI